ncbi:hypothetical protein ACLB2K_052817 [Fragaria x ananassa]
MLLEWLLECGVVDKMRLQVFVGEAFQGGLNSKCTRNRGAEISKVAEKKGTGKVASRRERKALGSREIGDEISKLTEKEGLPGVRFRDPAVQEVPGVGTGKGGAEISKLAEKEGTGKVASRRERKALGA